MTTTTNHDGADPATDQLRAALRELVEVNAQPFPAHGAPGHDDAQRRLRDTEANVHHAATQVRPCECPDRMATYALGVAGTAVGSAIGYLATTSTPDEWATYSPTLFAALDWIPAAIGALNGYPMHAAE